MKPFLATIFVVITGLLVVDGEVVVTLEPPTAFTNTNTDITITCQASGTAAGSYIQWYKQTSNGEKTITEQVSTNQNIITPYSKTKRYEGSYQEDGDTKTSSIIIRNAQVEDSGTYQCLESSSEAVEGKSLVVLGPITAFSILNHTEGAHIKLIEGQALPLVCQANGSVPAPSISLKIGERDITEEFVMTRHTYQQCPGAQGAGKECLIHSTHGLEASNHVFTPLVEDDGKMLVCLGKVPEAGEQFETKHASLHIEMEYPPKIDCQSVIDVETHKRNARIDCRIRSKPEHSAEAITWSWTSGDHKIELLPGETYEDVTAEHSTSDHTASLVFKQLFERHFDHHYTLNVSNIHGITTQTVMLEISTTTPKSGESIGDAGTAHWSTFLMSIILVYAAVIIIK